VIPKFKPECLPCLHRVSHKLLKQLSHRMALVEVGHHDWSDLQVEVGGIDVVVVADDLVDIVKG